MERRDERCELERMTQRVSAEVARWWEMARGEEGSSEAVEDYAL